MAIHDDRAYVSARRLRKDPTRAEKAFWRLARDKQIDGLRFRRQVPLGPYIADFCCLSERLVVEVDGGIHRLREDADRVRDAWLESQGFRVVRFGNEQVLGKPNLVLDAIRAAARTGEREDTPHPSGSACHLPPQGGKDMSTEIWFYHLERSSLGQVLPELLDRTLQRGWRAVVRVADPSQLEDIDENLWTWRDESFLAHGRADEPHAERQPILLTSSQENPNGAHALFIVDGSELGATETYERCFIIFEGRDETALHGARERWRVLKGQGANLAYWKQSDEGRWEKAA